MKFEPRPYQAPAIQFLMDNARCNLWADMGLGKSVSSLTALDLLTFFEDPYPALIIGPKRVARSVWTAEAAKWDHLKHLKIVAAVGSEAERRSAFMRRPDIMTINYENIPWMIDAMCKGGAAWPFRTVIADECFLEGTQIETPSGPRGIETLGKGDEVLTHLGPRKIVRRFTREVYTFNLVSVELSNGEIIYATENHPFFTDLGWLPASACRGRRVFGADQMPQLFEDFYAQRQQSAIPGETRKTPILFEGLPYDAPFCRAPRTANEDVEDDGAGQSRHEHVVEQRACVVGRTPQSDVRPSDSAGPTANGAGREWPGNGAERGFDLPASTSGLYLELRSVVGEAGTRVSKLLQSGLWQPCPQDSVGNRWKLPPYCVGQNTRREKGQEITIVGMERYANEQRRRVALAYDLEVEGAHSYFAGGVLVHNCTKLKGFRLRMGGQRAAKLGRVCVRPHRWINLTGTPAPNGLLDLWGQQYFIDQGARLGLSFTGFKERWFRPHPNGKSNWIPLPFAEENVHAALQDCTLTIRAKDWFDLREPIVNNVYVDLPAKVARAYREMENKMFMELNGIEFEAFSAAAKSQKCLQMASGAVYLNQDEDVKPLLNKPYEVVHDEKLDALEEIIEEAAGNPVLVAYQFRSDLDRLKKKFKNARELKTTKDEDDWNAGRIDILLAHPASAGHGLNLQHGGHIVVFFSNDWNLEFYQQIIERIGPVRQMQSGYDRPVYIHHLIARGTLDEVVMVRRESKRDVQDLLRDAMVLRRAA